MNRQEFTSLSLPAALGALWDAIQLTEAAEHLSGVEAPKPAFSPKYDGRCRTKGGLVYMSECDLSQLQYYYTRATRPTEEKYREKSEKEAKALLYWMKWRAENPDARWTGERYQQGQVTAAAPSSRPRVSDWNDTAPATDPAPAGGEVDYGSDDSLPFALNVTCESAERWWK